MIDISLLEDQIGYKFKNIKFLKIALTHKSYLDEKPELMSNQRYEFFGDAILDFDLTEYLFKNYPELDEGSLTKIRSSAVNQFNLVQIGKKIDIGKYLYLSKLYENAYFLLGMNHLGNYTIFLLFYFCFYEQLVDHLLSKRLDYLLSTHRCFLPIFD